MIYLTNIHKTFHNGQTPLHVLKGIDLRIETGEFVSVMGSSGSGKSTLLNIIGLLDTHDDGDYYLNNVHIQNMNEKDFAYFRNCMIGFVFQSFNLISFKNALENVSLPLYYQNIGRKQRNITAMEYLEKFKLLEWWDHKPNELSGGQKQRIAIARALITQPSILVADEPTGALDTQTSYEMMNMLKQVNQEGITTLIVTHEQDISKMTQKIIYLKDGIINDISYNAKSGSNRTGFPL